MKLFTSFIFLIILSNNAFSQSITGKIVDIENKPIEFAEAIVYENNKPIISEMTNIEGYFNLIINKKGTFKIIIRQLGNLFYEKDIEINNLNIDLGVISFDNSKQLNEVVITVKKKLIEKKSDRLIYNVQNSVFSNGVSGDELLKNIPRIDPNSDGLKIIGKSNVLIMIDDRIMNISGEDLRNYLKTLRSENIEKIEIITNPSAKYDASGNSGLINIKLKKKTNLGFDGNISSTFIQRTKPSTNNSLNLNYSNEKLILNYNIFYGNENRQSNYKNDYFFENETRKSIENTERINKGLSHNFNLDYQIFKGSNLGFYFNYGDWDNNSNRDSKVKFYDNMNTIYRSQNLPALTKSNYKGISFSPYLDIKLDTLGTKLKLFYNYNNNKRYSNTLLNSESYNGDFTNLINSNQNKNNIDNNFNINALGADIEATIFNSKIEIGTKYTNFKNDNDLKFYDSTSGADILDTSISNFFKYNEKLFATYLNFSKTLSEKVYLTAGVRYEYTNIEGLLVTQNKTNKNEYGNLFPNISVSYDPNDNNSYSLSYNKRISRPGLYDLNPFRVYKDANNYEVGNPDLLPNITNNVEFGYVYKGNLSFTVYGSRISNNWAYIVSSENNNNIIVTQPKNVLTTYDIGSEIAYNWKINNSISNYSSANVSYQKSNSSDPSLDDYDLNGIRGTISSNTTIMLNKDKTNKLFINMFYNTPGVEEMYISKNIFMLRIGTSWSFLSKKLNINAYLTDPFNTTIARNTVNFNNFQFENRIFNDNRSFNLSVVYKFGNNKSKNNERKVDNSEKDRLIKDK